MFDLHLIADALSDARVVRALEIALRDAAIRRRFRQMRREGIAARTAIEQLAERVCLSEERIRTIVYRKGIPDERTP